MVEGWTICLNKLNQTKFEYWFWNIF